MPAVTIKELINVEHAKQLLSLPDDVFKSIVWSDSSDMKGEKEQDQATYVKLLKQLCQSSIQSDGVLTVSYEFSKAMKTNGRRFAKPFGLQGVKAHVRGYLVGDEYLDYDMQNCHPTLLRSTVIQGIYYDNQESFKKEYPYLDQYVTNRSEFLERSECDKRDVLMMMNSGNTTHIENMHARGIDAEFKRIQSVIFDHDSFSDMTVYKPHPQTPNKKAKFLNRLLCIAENSILERVVDHYGVDQVSTLMFDGLHLPSKLEDQTETLNELTAEYGVTWKIKPFDMEINAAVLKASDGCPAYDFNDYQTVKGIFEKDHFIVRKPLGYFCESDEDAYGYNKGDFKDLVAPIQYTEVVKGDRVEKGIFDRWIKDPSRRSYTKKDFIPCENTDPTVYNTFAGFPYGDWRTADYEDRPDAVQDFKELISAVCADEGNTHQYLTNYFADLIQNPQNLPHVGLLLKSKPGRGKDSLIDIIQHLIGHCCRTANPENVLQGFNAEIKSTLLLQLNEIEGKDGFALKEKIKNLITEKETMIDDKFEKKYKQTNYLRVIICSNNMTPIEIPANGRRMAVIGGAIRKPVALLGRIQPLKEGTDQDGLYSIMKYLSEVDLKGFNIRDIPETRMLASMKGSNVSPLSYYLQDLFVAKEGFSTMFKLHKRTGRFQCRSARFYEEFVEYCSEVRNHGLKMTPQTLTKLLVEIDVERKTAKIGGVNTTCYFFHEQSILDHLSTENLETLEEVEDISDELEDIE